MLVRQSIIGRLSRGARDERGVSAVEFALLAPLMILLYFGLVEISDAVAVDRKVSLTAAALTNLTAQSSSDLSTTDMENILDASTSIVAPYSSSNLKLYVACVSIDANKLTTVKWSRSRNPTGQSVTVTVPTDLKIANSQLIYAEVTYAYTPVVGYTITGTLNLSDHMFMSPRSTTPTYNGTKCS